MRNPVRTINTNTMGTANLLEEARLGGTQKFLYISSAHVYGVPQYVPVDEAHPTVPREALRAVVERHALGVLGIAGPGDAVSGVPGPTEDEELENASP